MHRIQVCTSDFVVQRALDESNTNSVGQMISLDSDPLFEAFWVVWLAYLLILLLCDVVRSKPTIVKYRFDFGEWVRVPN